jgi:hypothetical protein
MQSVPGKIQDGVCPHFVSRRRQTDIRLSRVLHTNLGQKFHGKTALIRGLEREPDAKSACWTVSETRIIVRMPDQHSRIEPQCGSPRMRLTHQPRADSPTPAIGSHGEWRNAQRRCASDAVGNDDRCEQHMSHNPVALLGNERQFGNERRSTPQPRYQQVLRMVADRKIAESRLHQSLDTGPVRSLFLSDNHRRTCIKMKASGPFPDKRGGSDAADGCNVPKVN